jgi:hypothetical protein
MGILLILGIILLILWLLGLFVFSLVYCPRYSWTIKQLCDKMMACGKPLMFCQ